MSSSEHFADAIIETIEPNIVSKQQASTDTSRKDDAHLFLESRPSASAHSHRLPAEEVFLRTDGQNKLKWEEASKMIKVGFRPILSTSKSLGDLTALKKLLNIPKRSLFVTICSAAGDALVGAANKQSFDAIQLRIAENANALSLAKADWDKAKKKKADSRVDTKIADGFKSVSDHDLSEYIATVKQLFECSPLRPHEIMKTTLNPRLFNFVGASMIPTLRSELRPTARITWNTSNKSFKISLPLVHGSIAGMYPTGLKVEANWEYQFSPAVIPSDVSIPPRPDTVSLAFGSFKAFQDRDFEDVIRKEKVHGSCSIDQQVKGLELAKYLLAMLAPNISSRQQLTRQCSVLRSALGVFDERNRGKKRDDDSNVPMHYGGSPIFARSTYDKTDVEASTYVLNDVPGLPVITAIADRATMRRVQAVITERFFEIQKIEEAWLSGCIAADAYSTNPETMHTKCSCADRQTSSISHACDGCLNMKPCSDLSPFNGSDMFCCSGCRNRLQSAKASNEGVSPKGVQAKGNAAAKQDKHGGEPQLTLGKPRKARKQPYASVPYMTLRLHRKEAQAIALDGLSREQESTAILQMLKSVCRPDVKRTKKTGQDIEYYDSLTDQWRKELFYREGMRASPFIISAAARYPVFLFNGRMRLHVAPNILLMPLYTNFLQCTSPFRVLQIIWQLCLIDQEWRMGKIDDTRRQSYITKCTEMLEHMHLITNQVPFFRKDRFARDMGEDEWKVLKEQFDSGVADRQACHARLRKPWTIAGLRGTTDSNIHEAHVETPELDAVIFCLKEMDEQRTLMTWIGDVPWPFDFGPKPQAWTWPRFYVFMAKRLEMLTAKCNARWITSVTVPVLIVIVCWVTCERKSKDCRKEWRNLFSIPIGPYDGTLTKISLAKIVHAFPMTSGLRSDDEKFSCLADFDTSSNEGCLNIIPEPWGTNDARSNWDDFQDDMLKDFMSAKFSNFWKSLPKPTWDAKTFRGNPEAPDEPDGDAEAVTQSRHSRLMGLLDENESKKALEEQFGGDYHGSNGEEDSDGDGEDGDGSRPAASAAEVVGLELSSTSTTGASRSRHFRFQERTGSTLSIAPAKMSLLRELCNDLVNLFTMLNEPGRQLPNRISMDISTTVSKLEPEWRPGVFNDAPTFFAHVLQWMISATDTSRVAPAQTPASLAEDYILAQLGGEKPAPLKHDDILDLRKAFAAVGNASPLFELFANIVVKESRCPEPNCATITRQAEALPVILLQIPTSEPSMSIALADLLKLHFDDQIFESEDDSDGIKCSRNPEDHARSKRQVKRLVHSSRYFALQISRLDEHASLIRNTITIPEDLDLTAFFKQKLLSDESHGEAQPLPETGYKYQLAACIHYIPDYQHYVTYSRMGDDNRGPWVLFDDMKTFPIERTPASGLESGELASLLIFTRSDVPDAQLKTGRQRRRPSTSQDTRKPAPKKSRSIPDAGSRETSGATVEANLPLANQQASTNPADLAGGRSGTLRNIKKNFKSAMNLTKLFSSDPDRQVSSPVARDTSSGSHQSGLHAPEATVPTEDQGTAPGGPQDPPAASPKSSTTTRAPTRQTEQTVATSNTEMERILKRLTHLEQHNTQLEESSRRERNARRSHLQAQLAAARISERGSATVQRGLEEVQRSVSEIQNGATDMRRGASDLVAALQAELDGLQSEEGMEEGSAEDQVMG